MRFTVEEAATRLEELADRALAGEEIIITRQGGRDIRLERIPEDEWARMKLRLNSSAD